MADYDYSVAVSTTSATLSNGINVSSGSSGFHWNWDNCYYYYPYTYSYPVNHYFYSIKCPRCKTFNWCELDHIVPCKKCSSRLRAISDNVDYDVPVSHG